MVSAIVVTAGVESMATLIPPPATPTTTRPGEPELGTGDVQMTLRWSSTADLDLSVVDPTGAQIDFANPASPSGGQLDVDSNFDCATASATGVENVFWPTGAAPDGQYVITVTYFDVCEPAGTVPGGSSSCSGARARPESTALRR